MAEQDFVINVRTTADTAGIARMEAALTALGAKVNSITAAGGGAGGGGGGGEGGAGLLDKAAAKIEHGIFRTAVHAIGIGVVYELVGGIREASKEIEKMSDDLNKQGELLLRNAQLFGVQAQHATDASDVIKISENSLKQMEETQKKLNTLVQEELSYWAQFSDFVSKTYRFFSGGDPNKIRGDLEAAQQRNIQTATEQAEQAKKEAMREVDAAQRAQHRTNEEVIADTEHAIELEKERAAQARKNNDPLAYAEAVNALNRYNNELERALKIREQAERRRIQSIEEGNRMDEKAERFLEHAAKQREQFINKTQQYVLGASPQVQAILMNEKAMFEAREAGRGRDARLFEKTALSFHRGATPADEAELAKIYASPVIVKALQQIGANTREQVELWK